MEPLATFVPLPGHVLKVSGEIDLSNADAFAEALELNGTNGGVTIDASDLQYLDSAGLRVLLVMAKKVQQAKGKVALYGLVPNVREVFAVSGFDTIFSIQPDSAAALAAVR